MISKNGKGLTIGIDCEYRRHHHWMAFASWYSISKNLPDAKVSIFCERGIDKYHLFNWTHKISVPFSFNKKKVDLIIPPSVMAIRHYIPENLGPYNVKSEEFSTFVDYREGVGRFKLDRWIDNMRSPFYRKLSVLHNSDMTVNELKVLNLWENLFSIYAQIQRNNV